MDDVDEVVDTVTTEQNEDDEPWWAKHPHTTERAVPATECTAGVDVTLIDFTSIDEPPMLLLEEYYPGDDEPEGESIGLQGTAEALELASTILELVSSQHDLPAIDGDVLDDDEWSRDDRADATGGED